MKKTKTKSKNTKHEGEGYRRITRRKGSIEGSGFTRMADNIIQKLRVSTHCCCCCYVFCFVYFSNATIEEINHAVAGAMIRIVFADANLYGTGQIILPEMTIVSLCFEVSQQSRLQGSNWSKCAHKVLPS